MAHPLRCVCSPDSYRTTRHYYRFAGAHRVPYNIMLIGITGGIGTGKSTVAEMFRRRGAIVFSADEAAREIVAPGSPALQEIAERFGAQYILPDGGLDRSRLGAYVFAVPEARRDLEAIMHPRILQRLREQIDEARAHCGPETPIMVEAPLLFEAGMAAWFDRIVVVTATEATQVRRLYNRNGLDGDEARRRIAAQMPLAEKETLADIVVRNDGTLDELERVVDRVFVAFSTPK